MNRGRREVHGVPIHQVGIQGASRGTKPADHPGGCIRNKPFRNLSKTEGGRFLQQFPGHRPLPSPQ